MISNRAFAAFNSSVLSSFSGARSYKLFGEMFPAQLCLCLLLLAQLSTSGAYHPLTSFHSLANQDFSHCHRPVPRCFPLNPTQCLDITLPYRYTNLPHLKTENMTTTQYHETVNYINQQLDRFKGIRDNIPNCWKALQLVLCSVFFPRCDVDRNIVWLVPRDTCNIVRGPCRMIANFLNQYDFLRCDNETMFPKNCATKYTNIKFNSSFRCKYPLVPTDDAKTWYADIDGCAMHCHNPIYTSIQQQNIRTVIALGTAVNFVLSLASVVTFILSKQWPNYKSPSGILNIIDLLLLGNTFGWMLQFVVDANEVACRADHTARYSEPSSLGSHWCVISFACIYFFSSAVLIEFVHLSFSVANIYQRQKKGREVDAKDVVECQNFVRYVHIMPFCMLIFVLSLNLVDGHYMLGICTIGLHRPNSWAFFFLYLPFYSCALLFCVNMIRACRLVNEMLNFYVLGKVNKKLKRMFFVFVLSFIWMCLSIFWGTVVLMNQFGFVGNTDDIVRDDIMCRMNLNTTNDQQQYDYHMTSYDNKLHMIDEMVVNTAEDKERWFRYAGGSEDYHPGDYSVARCLRRRESPPMLHYYFPLFFYFSQSVVAFIWICNRTTLSLWKEFLYNFDCTGTPHKRKIHFNKHELVENRKEIINGNYVPKLCDPNVVDFELTSTISKEVSLSTFKKITNFSTDKKGFTSSMLQLLGIKQYSNNNSLVDVSQRDVESLADSNTSSSTQSVPLTLSLPPATRSSGPSRLAARHRSKTFNNITYSESNTTDDSLISSAFVTSRPLRKKFLSKSGSRQTTPKTVPSPQETIYQQTMLMEKLYEALNQQTQMLQAIQAMQATSMPIVKPVAKVSTNDDSYITLTSRLVKAQQTRRPKVKEEVFQFTHGMVEVADPTHCVYNQFTSPASKSIANNHNNISPFVGAPNNGLGNNMVTATLSNFQMNAGGHSNLVASTLNQNFPVYYSPSTQLQPPVPIANEPSMAQLDPTMNNMVIVEYEPVVVNSTTASIKHATGAFYGGNKGGVLGNQGHILPSTLMQPTMRPSYPVCRPQLIYRTHLKFDTNAAYQQQLENELNLTDAESIKQQRDELRHLVSAIPSSSESNFDISNMIMSESEYASESSRPVSCSTLSRTSLRRYERMKEEHNLISEVSTRLKMAEMKAGAGAVVVGKRRDVSDEDEPMLEDEEAHASDHTLDNEDRSDDDDDDDHHHHHHHQPHTTPSNENTPTNVQSHTKHKRNKKLRQAN